MLMEYEVNTMDVKALAPHVAWPSASMVLDMYDKRAFTCYSISLPTDDMKFEYIFVFSKQTASKGIIWSMTEP